MTPRVQSGKAKIRKSAYIKLKGFFVTKKPINKMKR
jgi:hypothetical protein